MFLVGILSWWYGDGWRARMSLVISRLDRTIDYFSIDLLAKTLFSPFRQISAGKVSGSLDVKIRAFVDKLISRLIGAAVRTVIMIVGGLAILLHTCWGLIIVLGWLVIPIVPVVGAIGWILG
ncbi:MAG: hypothetical protein L0H38_03575 [bacterium]|nr:hypothetical protein [bacterium]